MSETPSNRGWFPAFPVAATIYPNGQVEYGDNGMTIREHAQLQVMCALLQSPAYLTTKAEQCETAEQMRQAIVKSARDMVDSWLKPEPKTETPS